MILTGRRFPGSSAPGDLSSLGVGGRPVVFCGGLCVGRKAAVSYKVQAPNESKGCSLTNEHFITYIQPSNLIKELNPLPAPNNPQFQSVTYLFPL